MRAKGPRFPLDDERRQWIIDNMDLARILTWRLTMNGGLPALLTTEDLHQVGAEELIHCAQRYSKGGTATFRTYARACLEKTMIGTIQEARFGPSSGTLSRWKKNGIPRPLDMVSYDSMDREDYSFIENVAADEQEDFIKRISPEMAEKVLEELDRISRKKLDKRSKSGETGIVHTASSHEKYKGRYGAWTAYVNVLNKQNFCIGRFTTKDLAIDARRRFIDDLREFCLDVIWSKGRA